MPDIIADITDGRIGKVAFSSTTWADARDATTGNNVNTGDVNGDPFAVVSEITTSRGGIGACFRYFLAFDTSGVTGTVSSATITLTSDVISAAYSVGDIILVKASKPDLSTTIAAADFDAIPGFSTGNTMSGNVTDYSAEFTSFSNTDGAANVITLNSNALSDISSLSVFALVVVNFDKDYSNVAPSLGGTRFANGIYSANTTTNTAYKPKLSYTLATVASEIAKINAIAIASVDKIDGTAKANYSKVLGIDLP
jgi:hypothetical protein